jgi:prevent-host-death family protein
MLGVADAKRRLSELIDRVSTGERFVVARRGKPAVALVPPSPDIARIPNGPPIGLAAIAGALADWDDLDEVVEDIYRTRRRSKDRPPPELG